MAQSTPAAATALPIEPVWDPHTPSIAIDPANTCQIRATEVMKRTWILPGAETCQSSDGVNAVRDEKPCLNNTSVYKCQRNDFFNFIHHCLPL
jgi:hypothetical protein